MRSRPQMLVIVPRRGGNDLPSPDRGGAHRPHRCRDHPELFADVRGVGLHDLHAAGATAGSCPVNPAAAERSNGSWAPSTRPQMPETLEQLDLLLLTVATPAPCVRTASTTRRC